MAAEPSAAPGIDPGIDPDTHAIDPRSALQFVINVAVARNHGIPGDPAEATRAAHQVPDTSPRSCYARSARWP